VASWPMRLTDSVVEPFDSSKFRVTLPPTGPTKFNGHTSPARFRLRWLPCDGAVRRSGTFPAESCSGVPEIVICTGRGFPRGRGVEFLPNPPGALGKRLAPEDEKEEIRR
jgi:hypothetical protein